MKVNACWSKKKKKKVVLKCEWYHSNISFSREYISRWFTFEADWSKIKVNKNIVGENIIQDISTNTDNLKLILIWNVLIINVKSIHFSGYLHQRTIHDLYIDREIICDHMVRMYKLLQLVTLDAWSTAYLAQAIVVQMMSWWHH